MLPWYVERLRGVRKFLLDHPEFSDRQRLRGAIAIPTADPEELRLATTALKEGRPLPPPPRATAPPAKHPISMLRFARHPGVIEFVERSAGGVCECCKNPAPFRREDGSPYLEVHHVNMLAAGGYDDIKNAVALCPNCHRAFHHASDATRVQMLRRLRSNVPRLG
ncbi:HNH endonuclease [Sorangium sp. So ce381]|uniref:HNH endonuclease n=1 Tax=Sorangium sp. So ce381 TaxID=3133307 RepID=UPI003F5B04C8